MKIIFESKNFIFREFEIEDVDLIYELDSEPEIHKYLTSIPMKNKTEAELVITYFRNHYKQFNLGRWAIIRKSDNNFIGWAGIKFEKEIVMNRSNFYDFSGRIMKKFWQKGYSREVAKSCLNFGFEKLQLNEIIAMSRVDNYLSNNLLQKVGFECLDNFEFQNQKYNWYQITIKKYKNGKRS